MRAPLRVVRRILSLTYWTHHHFLTWQKTVAIFEGDMGGLKALREDRRVRRALVVCLGKEPRVLKLRIEIVAWHSFLKQLWTEELV